MLLKNYFSHISINCAKILLYQNISRGIDLKGENFTAKANSPCIYTVLGRIFHLKDFEISEKFAGRNFMMQ